jgi:hypothetical protein
MSLVKEEADTNSNDTVHKGKISTDAIAGAGKNNPEPRPAGETERLSTQDREGHLEPLFDDNVDHKFRDRWREIQTGFVDEPRRTVEQADELVAELMQRLAQSFSEQRSDLERQWDASEEVSTEDLRVALTRYRSFFERLLSI